MFRSMTEQTDLQIAKSLDERLPAKHAVVSNWQSAAFLRDEDSIQSSGPPGTEFFAAETERQNGLIRLDRTTRDRANQRIWQTCL
jgi:hypothetical protein